MRIVVARVQKHANYNNLVAVLKREYPAADIDILSPTQFIQDLRLKSTGIDRSRACPVMNEAPALAILPDITGNRSPYAAEFSGLRLGQELRTYMDWGGHVMAFCAAAVYLSRTSHFHFTGDERNTTCPTLKTMFVGSSVGPVRLENIDTGVVEGGKPFVTRVPVILQGRTEDTQTSVPYHDGPMFLLPYEKAMQDAGQRFDVLMRYQDETLRNPAAALVVNFERAAGKLVLSGPVPHAAPLNDAAAQRAFSHLVSPLSLSHLRPMAAA